MMSSTRSSPLLAALAAAVALAACGGGGTEPAAPGPVAGPSSPPDPAPSPAPVLGVTVPLEARTTPPTVVYPSDAWGVSRRAAFERVNATRAHAGLGLLAQSTAIDNAAMGHANWLAQRGNLFDHVQVPGSSGFTGVQPWDRVAAAGYGLAPHGFGLGANEVLVAPELSANGAQSGVDELVAGIYHRVALLDPGYVEAGVGAGVRAGTSGVVQDIGTTSLVINLARSSAAPMGQRIPPGPRNVDGVVVWPVDGATNVTRTNGQEIPAPPGGGLAPSVHCHNSERLVVGSFVMRETASGNAVPTVLIQQAGDTTGVLTYIPCFAALSPMTQLAANTRYTVEFTGSRVGAGVTTPVRRTWTFTTGVRNTGQRLCADGSYRGGSYGSFAGCDGVPPIS